MRNFIEKPQEGLNFGETCKRSFSNLFKLLEKCFGIPG